MKDNYYVGVGIALGVAFGAAFDNVGLGLALGIVFGAAYSVTLKKKDKNADEDDSEMESS